LQEAKTFDEKRHYVNFDYIWQKPELMEKCAEVIFEHILYLDSKHEILPKNKKGLLVICADNVDGNIGIIPISFLVAMKLNCAAAIWKEMANIELGTNEILGKKYSKKTCILIQDVISRGTTGIKVSHGLKKNNWKFGLYISAILNNRNGDSDIKNSISRINDVLGHAPFFSFLAKAEDLGK
jgi:orotate phosphoribosyltransferase-like protein